MSLHKHLALILALCIVAVSSAAAPVDGYWLGTLSVDSHKLRLQLNVQSDDSGLHCKLDSLDQMAFGIDCANVKLIGTEFSFDVPAVSGRWIGQLSSDHKRLKRRYAAVVLTNLALNPHGSLADALAHHIAQRLAGEPVIKP